MLITITFLAVNVENIKLGNNKEAGVKSKIPLLLLRIICIVINSLKLESVLKRRLYPHCINHLIYNPFRSHYLRQYSDRIS